MLLFFRNDTGFGGNNGFTDFKRILGFPITAPETRIGAVHDHRRSRCSAACCSRRCDRDARKLGRVLTAIRDAEIARDVLRLQPALLQALHLDVVGGALRHRRRAVRAAGRHHQPERDVARELDRDRDLGRGRRARHADRPGASAPASVNGAKSWFTRRCPSTGCTSSGCCSSSSRCSCRAASSGLVARQAQMARRRAPCRMAAAPTRTRDAGAASATAASVTARRRRHQRTAPILYLDDDPVSFDGFKALNDLNLDLDAGELRCVIGPNGAGKTTMMDVITGKTRPDAGTAFFGQTIDLTRLSEPEIARSRHRPQVPEADGVRRPHACSRTSSSRMKADKRVWPTLFAQARLDGSATASRRSSRRSARRRSGSASRACCRTARSSGSRSACC